MIKDIERNKIELVELMENVNPDKKLKTIVYFKGSLEDNKLISEYLDIFKDYGVKSINKDIYINGKLRDKEGLNNALMFSEINYLFLTVEVISSEVNTSAFIVINKEIINNDNYYIKMLMKDSTEIINKELMDFSEITFNLEIKIGNKIDKQKEGIMKAIKGGVKFGRKPKIFTEEQILEAVRLKESGYTSTSVANKFGVSRSTLLKKIREYRLKG